jgi:homeobox protein homothorax
MLRNRNLCIWNIIRWTNGVFVLCSQRPPSSSLSYGGHGNDDVRSPGSGGTPGPLSQPPSSQTLDHSDPGENLILISYT